MSVRLVSTTLQTASFVGLCTERVFIMTVEL